MLSLQLLPIMIRKKNYFNTRSIENVISTLLPINHNAVIVIKSTIPIGYTRAAERKI